MILPAPPLRRHFALAALAWTAFISYGSLVPLQFRSIDVAEALERFRNLPPPSVGLGLRSDVATNVLIFIPMTFLWMGALATDRRAGGRAVAAVAIVPLVLATAFALEFSQLWFQGRTPSTTDITAEISGGVIGMLLWFVAGQPCADWLRSYARDRRPKSRVERLLGAYTLGFIVYSVMPLDLTISLTELYRKYRSGRVVLLPFSYAYLSPLNAIYQFGADILIFVPVGAWLTLTLRDRWRAWPPVAIGAAVGGLLALAIEFVQLLVLSRYTDTTDVVLGGVGCTAGAWLVSRGDAPLASHPRPCHARRWLSIGLVMAGYSIFLLIGFWMPFDVSLDRDVVRGRLESFWAIPFAALYWSSPFTALTQMLLRLLLFAPLGALWALAASRARLDAVRRLLQVVGLAYAVGLALAIEVGQILMPSRVADPTEVLLCALGALAGLIAGTSVIPFRHDSDGDPLFRPGRRQDQSGATRKDD
jgi:glycopeptide antibiotics resistance protein